MARSPCSPDVAGRSSTIPRLSDGTHAKNGGSRNVLARPAGGSGWLKATIKFPYLAKNCIYRNTVKQVNLQAVIRGPTGEI